VNPEQFAADTEPFRRELLAHCYRMLGSVHDAEDLVQETYLRAWKAHDEFEARSSVRTWLYRIATNTCLNALEHSSRRLLPSGLGAPEADPLRPRVAADAAVTWLEPFPGADPAAIVASREGLRLALIASLQYLPATQRAVLILRDVLAFPAADVAAMLGTTATAVKSTLQRARARIQQLGLAADDVSEPDDPRARALLDAYIAAFENSDSATLERLLRADATLEATPWRTWFAGSATCVPFLRAQVLGPPGTWRMLATRANGQLAAASYVRAAGGSYQGYGILVLDVAADGIRKVTSFGDPGLLPAFGFPVTLHGPALGSAHDGRRSQ
jgi:RNA polymerase sigma-70 factor (ECF subfamily)